MHGLLEPSTPQGRYLPSGTRIGGWILDWPLGAGAAGVVYRCRPASGGGPPRALKLLRAQGDAVARARFAREIEVLRGLEHPCIVPLIEAGEHEGRPWLVMGLAPGRPLAALCTVPPVASAFALRVCAQIADALAYAHARGVAHRDVKPGNVLVDADGHAVLVDFGIAVAAEASRLTRAGDRSPTTPIYAPPEWWRGPLTEPEKGDVYALGVVLFELLTGRGAFAGVLPDDVAAHKAAGPPLDPGPRVTGEVRDLVRAMTAADPALRPTAREVVRRLPDARLDDLPPRSDQTLDVVPGVATPATLPAGDRVGPWLLVGELGRGGMGIVYRAVPVGGGAPVALKWMLHGAPGSVYERRFRQEIAALAQLDHPTLIPAREVGEHDGRLYYAMELIDGPDLATLLRERGLVGPDPAVGWGIELARALAHAHRNGIVHRDLKPANVLLERGERVRLADFGLARDLAPSRGLTQAGEVLGTPWYMAPEQARGLPAGPAADVYGLGVLLYELLAGRRPVRGDHVAQILHQLERGDVPRLDAVAAGVSPELARVVQRAMAFDPADRYPDMDALADDLARVRDGRRALDARLSLGAHARRLLRRHREALAVAGSLVALVALIGGSRLGYGAWSDWSRERAAEQRLATVEENVRNALVRGDPAEAERAFRGFVDLPENRGTRSMARAWLAQAGRLTGLDEGDAHRDALAHAWTAARDAEEAREALVGLGRSLARRFDWTGVGAAVRTLQEHGVTTDDARSLEAAWHYSRHDFDGGARVDRRQGIAPLLDALGQATRSAAGVTVLGRADLDGDGTAEVLLHEDGRSLSVAPSGDATFAHRRPLALPGGRHIGFPRLHALSKDVTLLLAWDTREATLYDLGVAGPRELVTWDEAQFKATTLADLDGDGVTELLVGTRAPTRHLLAIAPDASGAWRTRAPHPASDTQNSAFVGLSWEDFDGDGRPELFEARGAFGAYDVRMIGPDGALLGRRKLGDVQDGVAIRGPGGRRRIVAVRADVWPSRQGMPADAPFGEPRGIYVLDWDGTRFSTAWYLPTESECSESAVVDLDGDGLDDFAVACGESVVVARQRPDGRFVDVTLGGLHLSGAADVDGDGDGELQVAQADGAAWILGAGADHLPILDAPASSAAIPDDPAVARAEALVRMGLVAEGASALADRALQAPPGEERATLRLRIGELQEQLGRTDLAADSYTEAADAPGVRIAALRGAARAFERELRDDRALAAVDALLAEPAVPPDLRAELTESRSRLARRVEAPSVVLDFSEGLPDALEVLDPFQAWHDPVAGVLRVHQANDDVLARVPLTWDGRMLQLEVAMDLTRFEWAARLHIQVESASGAPGAWGAFVRAVGGAGELTTAPGCYLTTNVTPTVGWIRRAGPDWGEHVTLRYGMDFAAGQGACVWEGLPARYQAERAPGIAPPPGEYVLVIRGKDRDGVSVADAGIRRIVVRGATLRSGVPDRWPTARRSLATQAPADALAELAGADGPEAELMRVFALDEVGRWTEADRRFAALARGTGAALVRQRAPVLLRARGERFVARLRDAAGPDWPAWLWSAWEPAVHHHPDDEGWRTAFTSDLGNVGRFPPSPALLAVLVARGRAWRLAGRLSLAEQDLEAALALEPSLDGAPEVAGQLASARTELATVRIAQGRRDEALALVEDAVARAPAPEVWADVVLHRSELAPLALLAGWERVRAAAHIPEAGG